MNKKELMIVRVLGIFAVVYGLLGILASIHPPIIEGKAIVYNIPFFEIPLLVFGIGILSLKNWARIGMIFTCIALSGTISYNILMCVLSGASISIINSVFLSFLLLIVYFLNWLSVKELFKAEK